MKTKMLIFLATCVVSITSFFPSSAHAKSYWLTGGLIGAGVGLGAGVGIGYGVCGLAEENKAKCRYTAIPLGAVGMGGIGFGIGALIGSASKKDETALLDNNKGGNFAPSIMIDPKSDFYGVGAMVNF